MNILLVKPPVTQVEGDESTTIPTIPLSLGYIASYLEKHFYNVTILDAVVEGFDHSDMRYWMKGHDIIGITSTYSAFHQDAVKVAEVSKDLGALTVIGGGHASMYPKLLLEHADAVIVGAGESAFLELVEKHEQGKSIHDICGVHTGGSFTERKQIPNLDEIPFPARHLLPMDKYYKAQERNVYNMRNPVDFIVTSRGCPGNCCYCSIHSVWGNRWRGRSPENVADEIEFLTEKYGVREIHFYDDTINIGKKRMHEICDEIINRGLDIKWQTPNGISHWNLNADLLKKMKASGCYRVVFGIESGNQKTREFR